MKHINVGDRVRDNVTGFQGIAVGRTEWLHGCIRIIVQPEKLHDGKVIEAMSFDEPALKIVKKGVVKPETPDTGGPMPVPTRHSEPKRV